ncbi:hypothetical protein AVEN_195024-1, partial [Araneus ventricosus]
ANHVHSVAETVDTDADQTRKDALEVENLIRDAINKVNELIEELGKLAEGLQAHLGPDIDNLIRQAEYILEELRNRNFEPVQNDTIAEYTAAEERKYLVLSLFFCSILLQTWKVASQQCESYGWEESFTGVSMR